MNSATLEIVQNWKEMEEQRLNRYVRIDYDRLAELVQKNRREVFSIPNWHIPGIYPDGNLVFASYQLAVNCFNFAFNIFGTPGDKYRVAHFDSRERPFTGAFALDRKFYETFGGTIIQARDLAPHFQSLETVQKFFRGMNDIPFPELRYQCGKDYIRGLENCYDGNPLNLCEEVLRRDPRNDGPGLAAFDKGRGLVELLIDRFPVAYGEDVQNLDVSGRHFRFRFHKRAQLVAVMLHGRFLNSFGMIPPVIDIEEVGPIADYEVPKSLRTLEILRYSEELADCIDNWREIPKDSQMEIEIRAAMVAACCRLLDSFNECRRMDSRPPINICHLDFWLWSMGKDMPKKFPPHLTRTSSY